MCVSALTQMGWAGRGHGSLARLDPSRGTKQGWGEKEQCQAPQNQRPGLGLGFAPKGWTHFGGAGGLGDPGGGEEFKRLRTGPVERAAEAPACSIPAHCSSLKSACFCSLHNLIRFFEKANLYAFYEWRGWSGAQDCLPPRIPQGS